MAPLSGHKLTLDESPKLFRLNQVDEAFQFTRESEVIRFVLTFDCPEPSESRGNYRDAIAEASSRPPSGYIVAAVVRCVYASSRLPTCR
jgi:hypothetical protein